VIRFLDVGWTYQELREPLDEAIRQVLQSGWYIRGAACNMFEHDFGLHCGAQHSVGVANGLDALTLILRVLDLGPGDEVIVPAHTFIATWLSVVQTGATPVPVDACVRSMNMDLDRVADALTSRTRAVVGVHLYGNPVDFDQIRRLVHGRAIHLIEDAAQAHGAKLRDRPAGSLGDAAAFSFYPGKNLGAFGDGGAVTSEDRRLIERIRTLSNYGSAEKYRHEGQGVNSRLDELQAAVLRVKLAKLDVWNERRREIAHQYLSELEGVPGVRLPAIDSHATPSWHLFVIRTTGRDHLAEKLMGAGIESGIHYPTPIHRSGAFQEQYGHHRFPVTEEICRTCLSLPIGPHLSDNDVSQIVEAVRRSLG